MLLLGIDIGTSSVKVSVVDAVSQKALASAQFPDTESPIISLQLGWAEQSPDMWWEQAQQALAKCNASGKYDPQDIETPGLKSFEPLIPKQASQTTEKTTQR